MHPENGQTLVQEENSAGGLLHEQTSFVSETTFLLQVFNRLGLFLLIFFHLFLFAETSNWPAVVLLGDHG